MGSYTLQQLKKLSFDEIKELFESTMKRVNTFTPMESDDTVPKVVARSSKRDVEQELNKESLKTQKIGEGSEPAEESKDELSQEQLQQLMVIIPEEWMNVKDLQTKYPIIDWEVYTGDSRMYWKIIRVGNHTESIFSLCYLFRKSFSLTSMGDENPIRTLGDYSRPSHEGYRNTIEIPERNNVVPLRSDTIWLVQNGCLFHRLRSEDPNQHLKDFLKLVDS
ncbi:hypothetical protein Tco_1267236 [Tanacetum coccineum]